jgi:hypothetical protein
MEQHAFAPRSRLLDWFKEGWRPLKDYPYQPGDWAVLVYMPIYPKPVPLEEMIGWVRGFERPVYGINNRSAAAQSKAFTVRERAFAERVAA